MKVFFFSLFLSLSAFADVNDGWQPASDPFIMGEYVSNFSKLPAKGRAAGETRFWSGDYWALNRGSINYRWNANNKRGFNLDSPKREKAMRMSQRDLSILSPSEKYDIFIGRYDYPLKNEVGQIANKKADEWEGICHGWAPASVNHNEPTPKTVTNADGIVIPFGSSDIKALISYYYAYGFQVDNTYQMGLRCFGSRTRETCDNDLNAGAFHIILTNKIGIQKKAFIADLVKSKEVWNHPVWAFESRVVKMGGRPERNSAKGTVEVIRVKTDVFYTNESENFWETIMGTYLQDVMQKQYEYDLEINATGSIVGGKWKSSDRPDFIWNKSKPAQFEGTLSRLGELLND